MRLAERLNKTLGELLTNLHPGELDWWMAKDRIEAGGQVREDLRSAIIASTIANCHLGKDADPFSAVDFLPPEPALPESEQELPSEDELADKLFSVFKIKR